MFCTEELPKAKANNCYSRLLYCLRKLRRDLTRLAFDSHLIQSNAFESNASANANADESNASANASAARESSASASASANANANAAFALAFANASAFEHKPATWTHGQNEIHTLPKIFAENRLQKIITL